jgi:broad specificity phosphatase PhoE
VYVTSLRGTPVGNVIVIAHGTVIALFVAYYTSLPVLPLLPLWRRLGLPSFVVLTLQGFGLVVEVVEDVEGAL